MAVSVTRRGDELAAQLPFERVGGDAAATVRARWHDVDAFVLFLATGAAVRIVGPLLADKRTDPAVVCVDEAGRFAVALCGGHQGGANRLARAVAVRLGAEPVVTTATDAAGLPALDDLAGFEARGDVAAVTTALLDGRGVTLDNRLGWPVPAWLAGRTGPGDAGPGGEGPGGEGPGGEGPGGEGPGGAGPAAGGRRGEGGVIVTDRVGRAGPGQVVLCPPSLVAGVGASTDADPREVATLLAAALASAGLEAAAVAEVATLDRKVDEAGIVALGRPVRVFSADDLAAVAVPSPSQVVLEAVGTPSVAEAAALLAAGPGAELVVPKTVSGSATVAIARRRQPRGRLWVVGLGPGGPRHRTPAAAEAVRAAEVVIGYQPYLDLAADLLTPDQEVVASPIGDEVVRAKQALADAAGGRRVALVCSGDPGVYAMASLVMELAAEAGAGEWGTSIGASDTDVEVVPGVTAASAAAALLGAPLGHDHAVVSLSDLLTPWEAIATRVRAAAGADLAVAFYNPRSARRSWQLDAARRLLLEHRAPSTPVGVVTAATRPDERVEIVTLATLDPSAVGMATCVVVGSSATRVVNGRMVTPRGYQP